MHSVCFPLLTCQFFDVDISVTSHAFSSVTSEVFHVSFLVFDLFCLLNFELALPSWILLILGSFQVSDLGLFTVCFLRLNTMNCAWVIFALCLCLGPQPKMPKWTQMQTCKLLIWTKESVFWHYMHTHWNLTSTFHSSLAEHHTRQLGTVGSHVRCLGSK